MSIRRITNFVLPPLVFGVGLSVGVAFSIKKRAADFSAAVERRLTSDDTGTGSVRKSSPDSSSRFSSEADLVTAIMNAATEKDALLRAHQLRELMRDLNSAQLSSVFERATKIGDRDLRSLLLVPLLARWVEIDEPAAMAALKPFRDRTHAVWRVSWDSVEYSVNEAFAKVLPRLALAEAASAPTSWWAAPSAANALEVLANGDPVKKLAELARIPGSKMRDDLCRSALLALAKTDSKAAEAQLDLIADPRVRSRTQTAVLQALAEKDPAAAVDRVCELTRDSKDSTVGIDLANNVLRACARQNAADALASIERLPAELQGHARGGVLVGWAEKHPVEALEWAAANNVSILQTKAVVEIMDGGFGWNSLIQTAFDNDRENTLAWLRSQPPSPERDSLLCNGIWGATVEQRMAIYAELSPDSRPKAVTDIVNAFRGSGASEMDKWVRSLPEGNERVAGIEALATRQTTNDPDSIESITSAWPAGPERDAAFKGVASSLADNDPVRGLEFARQITDSKTRSHAFFTIAWSWPYRDRAAARSWLNSTPELTADEKRVLIRQFDES